RSRRTGEEYVLLVVDPQLPSPQELLHTTPASCKLVPRLQMKVNSKRQDRKAHDLNKVHSVDTAFLCVDTHCPSQKPILNQ
ncbi:hypothetical protein Taro_053159, partial [Colocasia esculenta]|nr:hypothetical protein [Colocasia esculenta]